MTSRLSPSTIIVVHGEFVRDIIMRERERGGGVEIEREKDEGEGRRG